MDGEARGAALDVGPEGVRDLDHGAERVGEVDAGVHFGPRADAAGEAELRVGRGQCAARVEQQPGIQRRGPRREHPEGGRSGEAIRRHGRHLHCQLHLPVQEGPQRVPEAHGARRLHRGVHGCGPGGLRATGPQRAVQACAGGEDQGVHGDRRPLRGSPGA
jgi:hypothetical protein